ncbi:MAG TPA: DUF423 domain-containing protein [Pirellulales bacterium]|nr:DUF423 domain-containing protein [Pirellulales bacterium]
MWLIVGGVLGALGVTLGAFGAHGLPKWLADHGRSVDEVTVAVSAFETAVRYQMYHALALVVIGALARQAPARWWDVAAALFVVGVLVFSGFLYAWVMTQVKTFALIVPLGGLAMIAGWIALIVAALKSR